MTGIIYVFVDANQDLYHAREPAELGVVMPESPPTYHLNENRRSTQAIHAFASRLGVRVPDAPAPMAVGPPGRPVGRLAATSRDTRSRPDPSLVRPPRLALRPSRGQYWRFAGPCAT